MIFTVLSEAAERGELLLVQDGMCRWHRRRDGVVVIREILVLPLQRRKGLGRSLVAEVLARSHGSAVQARCPVKYHEANQFWAAMGFTLITERQGINLWQRPAYA